MTETAVAVLSPSDAPGLQDLTATISSATPSAPFNPGVSFGLMPPGYVFAARYQIERVLGTGGMGAVYQARDQELGIAVALKVIRPDITANLAVAHDFEQRFKQELLMARQVTHRNVIRIHDLGEASGVKYITMQFVEGTDLDAILSQGKLPFERTLSFAKQLAAGLVGRARRGRHSPGSQAEEHPDRRPRHRLHLGLRSGQVNRIDDGRTHAHG